MVKMHIDQKETSDCFNCDKAFDNTVKLRAYLVLWFKGVIEGDFLSVSACCGICHNELVEWLS